MEIGAAFTFMFDDEEWIKKLAIGAGVFLAATLLSFVLIGIVLYLPLFGYMVEIARNVRDRRAPLLPEWDDWGGLFNKGLMVFAISFIYTLPILVLVCPIVLISIAGPAMAGAGSDAEGLIAFAIICLSCLVTILSFACAFLIPAATIRYIQEGNLGAALQFGAVINFIRENLSNYLVAILIIIVAQLVAQAIGSLVCGVGIIVSAVWATMVTGHLYGQLAQLDTYSSGEVIA